MASTLTNNLYPPIVDTYCPAFIGSDGCILKFSISKYNSLSEIGGVQVMVTRQSTGVSALDKTMYPGEVKTVRLIPDGHEDYYVTINANDLKDKNFYVNEFYLVQLRFVSSALNNDLSQNQPVTMSWNISNAQFLSEWSTTCLIKAMSEKPNFKFANLFFDDVSRKQTISLSSLELSGHMYFNDIQESETLHSYYCELYEANNSGVAIEKVYPFDDTVELQYSNKINDPNGIYFDIPYELKDHTNYIVQLHYTTINGYSDTAVCRVFTDFKNSDLTNLDVSVLVSTDVDNGLNIIALQSNTDKPFTGHFSLRRASSKTDFKAWEDIYHSTAQGVVFNADTDVYYDMSIESGVWYKYAIQERDIYRNRGENILATTNFSYRADGTVMWEKDSLDNYVDDAIICDFDGVFLTERTVVKKGDSNYAQLKFIFDTNIDSYTINKGEEKIETIGSKFPFIMRSGARNYRSFSLNGMIVSFMDDKDLFITDEELYGNSLALYHTYNNLYHVDIHRDYIKEKLFRDKAIAFLENTKNKLYRSSTEGNLIVQLLEKSFNPKQEVQGLVYTMQAQCVEIADIKTFEQLNESLDNVIELDTNMVWETIDIKNCQGSLELNTNFTDNVFDAIIEKHRQDCLDKEGLDCSISKINSFSLHYDTNYTTIDGVIKGHKFLLNGQPYILNSKQDFLFDAENFTDVVLKSLYLNTRMDGKVSKVTITYDVDLDLHKPIKQYTGSFSQQVLRQLHGNYFINNTSLRHAIEQQYDNYQVHDPDSNSIVVNAHNNDLFNLTIYHFNYILITSDLGFKYRIVYGDHTVSEEQSLTPDQNSIEIPNDDIYDIEIIAGQSQDILNSVLITVLYRVEGEC